MRKIIYILSGFVFLMSCDSRTYDEISDNTPIVEQVTYTKNVKPIIDANCISCHSAGGSAAYVPWTDYDQVKNNIDQILDRVQRQAGDPLRMPQGGSLSSGQINIFVKWKSDGLIEN